MSNAKPKTNPRIISYWGDCVVFTKQDSGDIEIFKSNGQEITKETNEKGRCNGAVTEEFKPLELFSTDDYEGAKKYANPDLFMPTCNGQESETRPKSRFAMAEKEVQ